MAVLLLKIPTVRAKYENSYTCVAHPLTFVYTYTLCNELQALGSNWETQFRKSEGFLHKILVKFIASFKNVLV